MKIEKQGLNFQILFFFNLPDYGVFILNLMFLKILCEIH